MIRVRFACGHDGVVVNPDQQPRCACGNTQVVDVQARAPRFVGHVQGPVAEFKDLPAEPVTLRTTS